MITMPLLPASNGCEAKSSGADAAILANHLWPMMPA